MLDFYSVLGKDFQKLNVGYLGSADNSFTPTFMSALQKLPLQKLVYFELRQKSNILQFQKPDFCLTTMLILKIIKENLLYIIRSYRLKYFCYKNSISFILCKTITDPILIQNAHNLDVIITAGMREIIPKSFYTILPYGIINFHYSLLPLYRGTMPLFWQAVCGDANYGFSFHRINELIDAGELILQKEIKLPEKVISYKQKGEFLTHEASKCFRELFSKMEEGYSLPEDLPIRQNKDFINYINIDNTSFDNSLVDKIKFTKTLIWERSYSLNVVNCRKTEAEDTVLIEKLLLVLIKNGIEIHLKAINFVPAVCYYWVFKKIWKKP